MTISPLPPSSAPPEVQKIYADIKIVLALNSVPHYFQILGNFPAFLSLLWSRLRPNLTDPNFLSFNSDLKTLSHQALSVLFSPPPQLQNLTATLSPQQKESLTNSFLDLENISLKLLLISIIVRESIKGVDLTNTPQHLQIEKSAPPPPPLSSLVTKETPSSLISQDPLSQNYLEEISQILESLQKTPAFLQIRLALEQKIHQQIRSLPHPFSLTYAEVITAIYNHPQAPELVFLLHDRFPAIFPKQFLGTTLLLLSLQSNQPLDVSHQPPELPLPSSETSPQLAPNPSSS